VLSADNLTPPSCAVVTKFVNFNFLEPSGLSRPVMGLLYLNHPPRTLEGLYKPVTEQLYLLFFCFSFSIFSISVLFLTRCVPIRTQPLTLYMFLSPRFRSEHFNNINLSSPSSSSSKRNGVSFFLKSSPNSSWLPNTSCSKSLLLP